MVNNTLEYGPWHTQLQKVIQVFPDGPGGAAALVPRFRQVVELHGDRNIVHPRST
jgi:hypothetical protein